MSRIGKAPIELPKGVEVKFEGGVIKVKGPKGELTQRMDSDFKLGVEDGMLEIVRPSDTKRHRSFHGLYRSLVNNMVIGVSEGYKKEMELVGVGYRASNLGQLLELTVGYSHPIFFAIPDEVKLTTVTEKGKTPRVVLESNDKQLIGQIAAKIRAFRKPEPYKGKGIKFVGEVIRRKAGKTAAK